MFDRDDVVALAREVDGWFGRVLSYPGLHYHVYPQDCFAEPAAEETIVIARAAKLADDRGVRFWVSARAKESDHDLAAYLARAPEHRVAYENELLSAEFAPLDEATFNDEVKKASASLRAPLALPLHAPVGFVGAQALFTMKTDFYISLFAEYEDELVHFAWWHTH